MSTPISDSLHLLKDAENQLTLIKISYENSFKEKEVSKMLRLKVKHFLDNIRSALDYAAWQIYTDKSRQNVGERNREKHEKGIYFPILKSKSNFDDIIRNKFPGVEEHNPEIKNILESAQGFMTVDGVNWTNNLVELSNNNKHRSLTAQKKKETVHIHKLVTNDGNVTITNTTFVGENGSSAFGMNDLDITNMNLGDFPSEFSYEGNVEVEFKFKDIDQPVLAVLDDIFYGASDVLGRLSDVLTAPNTE
ncbi:hypothetical protein EL84_25935 [Paenibacillus sp. VT-400]|uniref:hypothetical protein n=1 Tax=Paenibacillus sp. VT-400 TaxID=1495853 RepID=UPI00064B1FB8|nr:hypothetical protein [Paenibacillus sp. VT-400]KLU55485.1 hypothetical protein EL84_25935 [Paenibacillus sp. VT-400]